MIVYHLEVTTFEPAARLTKSILERPGDVLASLARLSPNSVVYVAAIEKNVDHGNFYLFLDGSGHAHVVLHEHREFLPRDPLNADAVGEVTFLSEDGAQVTVPSALTTSADRARAALEYWLPRQEHWPEFEWEEPQSDRVLTAKDGAAESPLHGAAWVGDLEEVTRLVAGGVDVNWRDSIGETALFGAAASGRVEVVRFLLQHFGEVDRLHAVALGGEPRKPRNDQSACRFRADPTLRTTRADFRLTSRMSMARANMCHI